MNRFLLSLETLFSQPFTNPASRTFWAGWVSMFLVVAVLHLKREKRLQGLLGAFLPAPLWKHQSTRLDLQLLLGKQALRLLGLLPVVAGSWWIATHLVRKMDTWFTVPEISAPPTWVALIYSMTLFIAWDASRYIVHRAMHTFPALWQFHQVHHSAEVLTPLTFHRTHPVETFIFQLRGLLVSGVVTGLFFWLFRSATSDVTLFGVHALGFLFNIAAGNLRHSHIAIGFGFLERWLISPAQHQIHHGSTAAEQHRNYGTWLAIWDRMGGTFLPSKGSLPQAFGLKRSERNHGDDLISAWFGPLRGFVSHLTPQQWLPIATTLTGIGLSAVPVPAYGTPTLPSSETEPDSLTDNSDEIIVTSDKGVPLVAGSAHVVTKESLERMEYDDIHRVLGEVPGVYVRGEDGFGLRPNIGIRGANSDRSAKITLMEDGVLFAPAPYAAPAAYYFPMATRMVGVEVFKGAAGTQFGPNTVGGAINLLTRDTPEETASGVDLGFGSRLNSKAHGWTGFSHKQWSFLAEGVVLHGGGFKELDTGDFTGFDRAEFMTKVKWSGDTSRDVRHGLEWKLGYAHEHSRETYLGLSTDDYDENPYRRYAASANAKMRWHRTQAELLWPVEIGDNIDIRTVAYHHYMTRSWTKFNRFNSSVDVHDILQNPASGQSAVYLDILRGNEDSISEDQNLMIGTNLRAYHSYGLQSRARFRVRNNKGLRNTLELGIRLHGDAVDRLHTEEPFRMESGILRHSGGDTLVQLDSHADALAFAAHIHNDLEYGRFRFLPGVRVESIRTRYTLDTEKTGIAVHRTNAMPGFGATARLAPWADVFMGVHRGFSPVAPGQPSEVRPESSWNYETGLRLHPGIRIDIAGFVNDYTNLTGQCTLSSGCEDSEIGRQFNGGRALIYGVETAAAHTFYLPAAMSLPFQLSYTWTGTQFRSDFTSDFSQFGTVERGDRLPYVPEHQVSAQFSVVHPNLEVTVVGQLRTGMLDASGAQGPVSSTDIPSLGLLDAAVAVPIGNRFRVYASSTNLTGSTQKVSWRPMGARPTAPRQFMVGLKMHPPK
jgi:Fe(3+) dicitrate transport protein